RGGLLGPPPLGGRLAASGLAPSRLRAAGPGCLAVACCRPGFVSRLAFVRLAGPGGRAPRGLTAAARPLVRLSGQILGCRGGLPRRGTLPPGAAAELALARLDGLGAAEVGGRAGSLTPPAACGRGGA